VIDRDELAAWLRLVETQGVGRESARRLLAEFGSAEAVLGASVEARKAIVGAPAATALGTEPAGFEALLAATCAWLDAAADESRDVVVLGDPRFPEALLNTADPPLLLYARGHIDLLNATSMAVVGSRNPTAQGLENARAFSAHLSRAGLVVVSGMALGIDAAAHEGALEGSTASIPRAIARSPIGSSPTASSSASSPSACRHLRRTFRCATASSPDWRAARSSSRRRCSRAR
jgi:DNA processing protein